VIVINNSYICTVYKEKGNLGGQNVIT
jgi:hypothetical protein